MKFFITVFGKEYPIDLEQKSKTVWVAVGVYDHNEICVKGKNAYSAKMKWVEAAKNLCKS